MKFFSITILVVAFFFAVTSCKKDSPIIEPATNKAVFMTDMDGGLYAFNGETGAAIWERHIENAITDYSIVADGLLFVPHFDQTIQAFDLSSGKVKWNAKFDLSEMTGWEVVVTNGVVCTSGTKKVIGIEANTGQRKWELPIDGQLYAKQGILYVVSSLNLYAIEVATGTIKWKTAYDDTNKAQVVIDKHYLYVRAEKIDINSSPSPTSGFKHYQVLQMFDIRTGKSGWSQRMTDLPDASLFASSEDYLYVVGATNSRLRAISKQNGHLLWETTLIKGIYFSIPFYSNSYLLVGNENGSLYRVNGDGIFNEFFKANEAIRSSPVVANGIIYVGSNDGQLYAIEETTGKKKWSVPLKGNVAISSPVVLDSNGKVYHYAYSGVKD